MTNDLLDQPDAPRTAERLDVDRLAPWLRENLPGFAGELAVKQFRKGHSNLTYLVSDGAHSWVLRRPPFGVGAGPAHDMSREFRLLSKLHTAYACAPRAIAFCENAEILGAPFYVMDALQGVILRRSAPAGLVFDGACQTALWDSFVRELAAIHSVDLDAAGLADFGRPEGYIRRQVDGWTGRYRKSETDRIDAIDDVVAWLDANVPAELSPSLLHNDYKLDNLVLDPSYASKIIGVLDWEMATVGDPRMDLGTTLAYHVDLADPDDVKFLPLNLPPNEYTPTRRQLVERYGHVSGRDTGDMLYFYVYGLFKIAVVAQQIYYRYKTGKTNDERFAMMIMGVQALAAQAARSLEKLSV